jgi:RNA polymerase sigma-70 factor (ECF subfamily)
MFGRAFLRVFTERITVRFFGAEALPLKVEPKILFLTEDLIMFHSENSYTLRMEVAGGITRYFASFTDGQGTKHETEISLGDYLQFNWLVRYERNLQRYDERYLEHSDLTENTLQRRQLNQPKSVEDAVLDNERDDELRKAIRRLPEKQRRRFVLYHEYGLTYAQIATMENCSIRAVKYSTDLAKEKIKKKYKFF